MNKIIVENDTMRFYSTPVPIPVGGSQWSKIFFMFSNEWEDLRKIAQFRQGELKINVDIDSNNFCYVPNEMLPDMCGELSIVGYPQDTASATIATANSLMLNFVQGFESGGEPAVPPTPDLYQKLLKEFAEFGGGNPDAVLYSKQELTDEQQAQARKNITVTKSYQIPTRVSGNDLLVDGWAAAGGYPSGFDIIAYDIERGALPYFVADDCIFLCTGIHHSARDSITFVSGTVDYSNLTRIVYKNAYWESGTSIIDIHTMKIAPQDIEERAQTAYFYVGPYGYIYGQHYEELIGDKPTYEFAQKYPCAVVNGKFNNAVLTLFGISEELKRIIYLRTDATPDGKVKVQGLTVGDETTPFEVIDMDIPLYIKPADGIPKSDLEQSIQTSLDKADTALQSQTIPDWNQNDETAPDYVKNRPFYTGDPVEMVLVEESSVSFAPSSGFYSASFPASFNAEFGQTYKISWDGTVYECTCKNFRNLPIIGNQSILGFGPDTGEPFLIFNEEGWESLTTDTSDSHTVSISGIGVPVTKIDEKYLPELPYMDKVNPTGTGAFSLNRKADTTIGNYSFAEGTDTTASGEVSHAEGYNTTASGYASHAEGHNTTASGEVSHAEGTDTTASGEVSHAEGYYTKASSKYQHVHGKYNIEDTSNTYAEIVGNGDATKSSNAHTLDWSGNAWYAGDVYVRSTSGTDKDEGSKKLATEEYVDTAKTEAQQLGLTAATPGQIIKVKTVQDGKPTEWEAVDMPGGGDEWELIAHINVADDVEKDVTVWEYNNLPRYKYIAYKKVNLVGSGDQTASGCTIQINNESSQASGMTYGKSGSPQNCIGMIYVMPFGWTHYKTVDAISPNNPALGGFNAMLSALPLSDNAITSIKLSAHTTYKIASGEIWLYGKKG